MFVGECPVSNLQRDSDDKCSRQSRKAAIHILQLRIAAGKRQKQQAIGDEDYRSRHWIGCPRTIEILHMKGDAKAAGRTDWPSKWIFSEIFFVHLRWTARG